jgi:hypothetical protein
MNLEPGDIFLTANTHPWWKPVGFVSAAIRFFTRTAGESRTKANHVGLVVGHGDTSTAPIIEALTTVKLRRMSSYRAKPTTDVAIFRPINLTDNELVAVVDRALTYANAKYGYHLIALHMADWLVGGGGRRDDYLFRRLGSHRYPICSWVVAYAFAEVGKDFGVKPGAASPDCIWDFAVANPDKYAVVHPLEMLP